MKEKILGLRKNIFFLGLVSLFNDLSSEMAFSVMPAFFTSVLHAGAASLGLVDGIAESASNFFKIYSGGLSDKIQKRKPLVILGYGLSVFTRPFYPLLATVSGVLGLRIADRIGKGMRDAPRDALLSLSSPPEELGRSFGYHRAMDTVGAILGPLAAYGILRFFPLRFDLVFFTAFGAGLFALIALMFISEVSGVISKKSAGIFSSYRTMPRQFKLFLASVFFLSSGSIPIAIVLLKTNAAGLALAFIPLFYAVYNGSYAALSLPAGAVSDRIGPYRVLYAGYFLLLAGYALLHFANSAAALATGFFVLGIFTALTDGVSRALAGRITAESFRGSAFGLLNAASGFGALIAGIGGGFLWQAYGPAAAFAVASIFVITGLFMFISVSHSQNNANPESI